VEGNPDGFSTDDYSAPCDKVFLFPKVERDNRDRPVQPNASQPCTCKRRSAVSITPALELEGAVRAGWIHFFIEKGYINKDYAIQWERDHAVHLSAFLYSHLLTICGTPIRLQPVRPLPVRLADVEWAVRV
jgi:hypothetical protein